MMNPSNTKRDQMTMIDHLTELRRRLMMVVIVLLTTMVIGFFFAGDLIEIVKNRPPALGLDWNVFAPSDAVRIYLQFAFVIGLVLTLPFLLYQIWGFVAPGLQPEEKKVTLSFIPAAVFLFLIGLSFGYFIVFPMVFLFLSNVAASLEVTETYGIAEFFGFMFNIILPLGFLFELPIIIMFLTRLRILNPKRLSQFRKYAYFILIVAAVMITPPEIVSDLLVSIPLLLLYEFSIWLSSVVYRKQLAEDARRDQEWANEQG
jgi:sec-independent protein translocase protein TatC